MPVIQDHPDWWVVITLDGFGSHLNVHSAQVTYAEYKIFVVKEEGDTSHINQAYDQSVAKCNKKELRKAMHQIGRQLKIDQWILISIAMVTQLNVAAEEWISSHKKVNMHPKHRIPFAAWMKELEDRGVLKQGENYKPRVGLWDAMPACWIHLSVEDRHSVISIIDRHHTNCNIWAYVMIPSNTLSPTLPRHFTRSLWYSPGAILSESSNFMEPTISARCCFPLSSGLFM